MVVPRRIQASLFALFTVLLGCGGGSSGPGDPPAAPPPSMEEFWVRNPSTGVNLYGHLHRPPSLQAGQTCPAVVLVPGGTGDGSGFDTQGQVQLFAAAGFLVVHFDPDGRGRSTNGGTFTVEDQDGFLHQDGLWAVLAWVVSLPEIRKDCLGVVSFSYGVTMAAGCLSRYNGNPAVKFLVEWEGPADRTDTARPHGHIDHDLDDDAWWSQREARTLIGGYTGILLAVQSQQDHVQPDNQHTLDIVNAATGTAYGGTGHCRWTRVNSASGLTQNAPNRTYSNTSPPQWLPAGVSTNTLMRDYLLELAAMP